MLFGHLWKDIFEVEPLRRCCGDLPGEGDPLDEAARHMTTSTRDVIIRTEDFDAARAFCGRLGFVQSHAAENLVGFETGGFTLYVERGEGHGAVFDFEVDSLEQAKSALLAVGCTVVEENPAVPRCYIRDPFGLTFNIAQR
ncbi:MAG: VOC family protein [Candidatus Tumulicola sp.]